VAKPQLLLRRLFCFSLLNFKAFQRVQKSHGDLFYITDSSSLNDLAKGSKIILGLIRIQIALAMQLAKAFEFQREFAV